MNKETISDENLRDFVRRSMDERAQDYAGASFQELWSRAREAHVAATQKKSPSMWFRGALAPALAFSAIAFFAQLYWRKTVSPVEAVPIVAAKLQLPTDALLWSAQHSYFVVKVEFHAPKFNLIQPEFPTDSLKWRTQ